MGGVELETRVGVSWRGRRLTAPLVRKRGADNCLGWGRVLINFWPPLTPLVLPNSKMRFEFRFCW